MRFFQTLSAGAALLAAAFAVEINEFPSEVQAGRSYRITYTPGDDALTTFILRQGADQNNLNTIATLTTTATGGEFTWEVSEDLVNGEDYALQVIQGGSDNYIGPISVSGSSASAAPSSSAAATSAAATESSAAVTTAAPSTIVSVTTASASVSLSQSANGTVTTGFTRTPSATGAESTGASPTESGGAPPEGNSASSIGSSPFALIFGAVAAMAYLH